MGFARADSFQFFFEVYVLYTKRSMNFRAVYCVGNDLMCSHDMCLMVMALSSKQQAANSKQQQQPSDQAHILRNRLVLHTVVALLIDIK